MLQKSLTIGPRTKNEQKPKKYGDFDAQAHIWVGFHLGMRARISALGRAYGHARGHFGTFGHARGHFGALARVTLPLMIT